MNQKELTKAFLMISNWKKTFSCDVFFYKLFSALIGRYDPLIPFTTNTKDDQLSYSSRPVTFQDMSINISLFLDKVLLMVVNTAVCRGLVFRFHRHKVFLPSPLIKTSYCVLLWWPGVDALNFLYITNSNFKARVWRTMPSDSSNDPWAVLLSRFRPVL